jgi:hypothetical protein
MTDEIRIEFPEGGSWTAYGFGTVAEKADVQSHVAGSAPHSGLIELIDPVVNSEPGDEPKVLVDANGDEWYCVGWEDDDLVYRRA